MIKLPSNIDGSWVEYEYTNTRIQQPFARHRQVIFMVAKPLDSRIWMEMKNTEDMHDSVLFQLYSNSISWIHSRSDASGGGLNR